MITLRPAIFSDYPSVASLHAENWRLNYRGIMGDEYLDNQVEKERLETWNARRKNPQSNQYLSVAEREGELVGFCYLILNEDPVYGSYIDNLHVSSLHQKTGLGKMLIRHAAKLIAEKADSKKMYLWVYELNRNARAAYERLGATHFETLDKPTEDGKMAKTCRYTWNDISHLL